MFYLLNVITVQWVTILSISGLYSGATSKHHQNNDVCAPAVTKGHVTPDVSAADTFNLQHVSDGVHVGAN